MKPEEQKIAIAKAYGKEEAISEENLYQIEHGNGWLGSKSNLGKVFVIAKTAKEAKGKIKQQRGIIKIGSCLQINCIK
jgi:hypothetical protein